MTSSSPMMTSFRRPWPVLFLCCVLVFNGMGMAFGMGAIFTDMMDTFRVSRATTSTVQSLCTGFALGAGIVTGHLVQWRGPKAAVIAGSAVATAGCVIAFLATHIVQVIVGLGVITGFGISFNYLTAITLPGIMFKDRKKRSVAMSLFNVSSAAGSSLYPLILRHVTNEYSLRGTFMILAAVNCQMALCGALIGFFALRRRNRRPSVNIALVKDRQESKGCDSAPLVVGDGEDIQRVRCEQESRDGSAPKLELNDTSLPELAGDKGEERFDHSAKRRNKVCSSNDKSSNVRPEDDNDSAAADGENCYLLDHTEGSTQAAVAVPSEDTLILQAKNSSLEKVDDEGGSLQESSRYLGHEAEMSKNHLVLQSENTPLRISSGEVEDTSEDPRQSRHGNDTHCIDNASFLQPAGMSSCDGDDNRLENSRRLRHRTETHSNSHVSILQEGTTPLGEANGDKNVHHHINTLRRGDEEHSNASTHQQEITSPDIVTSEEQNRNQGLPEHERKARHRTTWTLHLEVLRNAPFVVFVVFGQTSLLFFNHPWMFMTDMVQSNNLTVEDGSSFITFIFVGNLAGRVISGVLYRLLKSGVLVACSVAVGTGGVTCLFYAFSGDYAHFVAVSLIFGTSFGVLSATVPMSVLETVGPGKFAVGVSYLTFLEGVSLLVSGPFGGLVRDLTDSYQPLYYIAIVHGLLAGALLFVTALRYMRRPLS